MNLGFCKWDDLPQRCSCFYTIARAFIAEQGHWKPCFMHTLYIKLSRPRGICPTTIALNILSNQQQASWPTGSKVTIICLIKAQGTVARLGYDIIRWKLIFWLFQCGFGLRIGELLIRKLSRFWSTWAAVAPPKSWGTFIRGCAFNRHITVYCRSTYVRCYKCSLFGKSEHFARYKCSRFWELVNRIQWLQEMFARY